MQTKHFHAHLHPLGKHLRNTSRNDRMPSYILIVTSCSQTDNTATDLTRITEDYGLQAAGGLTKENDKQIWLKENIGIYSSTRKRIKIA